MLAGRRGKDGMGGVSGVTIYGDWGRSGVFGLTRWALFE